MFLLMKYVLPSSAHPKMMPSDVLFLPTKNVKPNNIQFIMQETR